MILEDTYNYIDYRKDDNSPFYVGIGNSKRINNYNRNKFHTAVKNKHGMYRVVIQGPVTWDQACATEINLISEYKNKGYKLTNITEGGEGKKGVPTSQKQKEATSYRSKGNTYKTGIPASPKQKAAVSKSIHNKTPEHAANYSAGSKAVKDKLFKHSITGEIAKAASWFRRDYANQKQYLIPC